MNRSVLVFALAIGVLVTGAVTNALVSTSLQMGYTIGLTTGMIFAFFWAVTYEWRKSGVPKELQGPKQCENCGVLSSDFVSAAKHVMQSGHPSFHSYPKREVNQ